MSKYTDSDSHQKRQCDVWRSDILAGGHTVRHYEFDTISSTMDAAVRLTGEERGDWTLVTARRQSSGRGTHGRSWYSESFEALYCSLVLAPPEDIGTLGDLSVRTAEVLVDTLEDEYGVSAQVKHPNDVLINGRKVAGILYESVTSGDVMTSLVLGMGVNIGQSGEEFEAAALTEATSLSAAAGVTIDAEWLLISFLSRFIPLYEAMTE